MYNFIRSCYDDFMTGDAVDSEEAKRKQRSWNMSRVRSKDTGVEKRVRSWLWREGFRFRKNVKQLPGCPDIVLPKYKAVIDVRGCFWHRHPNCPIATMPKSNSAFWWKKFNRNVNRDLETEKALAALGWRVIVVWECELENDVCSATFERLRDALLNYDDRTAQYEPVMGVAEEMSGYDVNEGEIKMKTIVSACVGMMGVVAQGAEVYAYAGCTVDAKKEGIHVLKVNTETGAIQPAWVLSGVEGTTYFALNKAKTFLYTAHTDANLPKGKNGTIACYKIAGEKLVLVNQVALGCGSPCHVSLDKEEKAVVWADYGSAISGVCEIQDDGLLATKTPVTIQHVGSGPDKSRQEKAHAHCAMLTPDNRYVFFVDLGMDQVRFYDFAKRSEGLREVEALRITTAPGAGPRHVTFHPNGKWLFLLNELNNTISTYSYTCEGTKHICTLSTIPSDFKEFSKASAIKITADGKMIFAGNRGHDSIAAFAVDEKTGKLAFMTRSMLKGKFPRDFTLMPGEKFMLVGHETSNEIYSYALDRATGSLTPVSGPILAHKPLCFVFGTLL